MRYTPKSMTWLPYAHAVGLSSETPLKRLSTIRDLPMFMLAAVLRGAGSRPSILVTLFFSISPRTRRCGGKQDTLTNTSGAHTMLSGHAKWEDLDGGARRPIHCCHVYMESPSFRPSKSTSGVISERPPPASSSVSPSPIRQYRGLHC